MPAKSGASHAGAAFLSIVIGSLLSNYLSAHSTVIQDATTTVGANVQTVTGLAVSPTLVGLATIGTVLSFVWGVAYHLSRH
jgi:hypothetical protein